MVDPIDVGADLKVTTDPLPVEGTVTNIWIDEDGVPQVTVDWNTGVHADRHPESLTYSDIREKMESGEVERTNSGHDAWVWRENR